MAAAAGKRIVPGNVFLGFEVWCCSVAATPHPCRLLGNGRFRTSTVSARSHWTTATRNRNTRPQHTTANAQSQCAATTAHSRNHNARNRNRATKNAQPCKRKTTQTHNRANTRPHDNHTNSQPRKRTTVPTHQKTERKRAATDAQTQTRKREHANIQPQKR